MLLGWLGAEDRDARVPGCLAALGQDMYYGARGAFKPHPNPGVCDAAPGCIGPHRASMCKTGPFGSSCASQDRAESKRRIAKLHVEELALM